MSREVTQNRGGLPLRDLKCESSESMVMHVLNRYRIDLTNPIAAMRARNKCTEKAYLEGIFPGLKKFEICHAPRHSFSDENGVDIQVRVVSDDFFGLQLGIQVKSSLGGADRYLAEAVEIAKRYRSPEEIDLLSDERLALLQMLRNRRVLLVANPRRNPQVIEEEMWKQIKRIATCQKYLHKNVLSTSRLAGYREWSENFLRRKNGTDFAHNNLEGNNLSNYMSWEL